MTDRIRGPRPQAAFPPQRTSATTWIAGGMSGASGKPGFGASPVVVVAYSEKRSSSHGSALLLYP